MLPFDQLNEADVREEVIAPLLARLGYRTGTENNIVREQSLRYPRSFLGRKKKSDPLLRGAADYILTAGGRVAWVMEAKPPSPITLDDIEQAWSYANHAEVRAVYFVICNGLSLSVYQTQASPDSKPVLEVTYENFGTRFDQIAGRLGPAALLRDFPLAQLDDTDPVGPGLRSVCRITSGLVQFEESSLVSPIVGELRSSIQSGAIERDEAGSLVVYLETQAPMLSLQEVNERLGLSAFEMISTDSHLSDDPARPTVFEYEKRIVFPEGTVFKDIATLEPILLTRNMTCHAKAVASCTFNPGTKVLNGRFAVRTHYLEVDHHHSLTGSFVAHLV